MAEAELRAPLRRSRSLASLALDEKPRGASPLLPTGPVLRVVDPREAYFWATHEGAELDLMLTSRGARWGFEFKRVDAPRATKSMQIARNDLGLREILVVHPGPGTHRLGDGVSAVGLGALGEALAARKLVR